MIEGRVAPGGFGRSDEGARGRLTRVALCAVLLFVALAIPAIALAAEVPPHVTTEEGPDACAMCHRAHTAPGVVARSQFGSWETTGSALVIADPSSNSGDAALCLTCHGVEGFGSRLVVQDDFIRDSAHTLLPDASRYEEVPDKQCSSCHDAHGSEKRDDGTPFPGLLRAFTEGGDPVYAGEEYCATCHYDDRDQYDNRFDGLSIYEQTAHFGLPYPASGTDVTCSNCHASHGSDVAPLIAAEIVPPVVAPAIPETATITANDRTLCYACHTVAQATWLGKDVYDDEATETVHGSSSFEVSVTAEYASVETTRLAGECQSCHNPMGSDNGDGKPIAKLAEFEGRELCYSCHNEDNAADITDMKSFGVFPDDIAGEPELVVAWDPANLPAAYGGLHVYTRAFGDDTAPYGLEGPRRYKPTTGLTPPRTGAIAYGDIDVSGETALVVADPATPVLRVFRPSKLAGLVEDEGVNGSITATATALAVGDFVVDPDGLPEVAALSAEAGGESFLRLYRWKANGLSGSLDPVASYPVGWDATGLAAGNLGPGKENALVVTARSAESMESTGAVFVLYRGDDDSELTADDPFFTVVPGPRGPSIGPVLNGQPGIIVANAGAGVPSISVYSPTGGSHDEYQVFGGGVAWETIVGDFMSGGGTGVAVAVRSETGDNAVSTFAANGASLANRVDVPTGARSATSSLALGGLTANTTQIVVGNAGLLSRVEGQSVSPSTQVITANGSGFEISDPRWAGGAELAGGTPALAVVDLGPVGRSRHPASAIEGAHVSTETAGFDRHAECVDCHNVHAATVEPANNAPFAYGAIAGTWGLDVVTDALVEVVEREYEMCFKCHATADWGYSPRDIASELDSGNAGFHPVMDASSDPVSPATLVNGWEPGSRMYCIDCHGNAGAGPTGPHVSPEAPLLSRPYIGSDPDDDGMLCYACHAYREYHANPGPPITPLGTGSLFYDKTDTLDEPHLHKRHVGLHGLGCETCHVSHGGINYRLIRDDVDWVDVTDGGACYTSCHGPGTVNAYSRTEPESGVDPSSVEVLGSFDDAYTPTVSLIHFQDGVNLTVREKAGSTQPVLRVEVGFAGVTATPARLELYGWYNGPGTPHTVNVQARDYTAGAGAFVTIGQLLPALGPAAHSYALDPAYVSGGQVLIRIDHASQGNSGHYLHLDRVWLD
jgi:predicted CXXCH cytochrome family protein